MTKIIYYAHSMYKYNTKGEIAEIEQIKTKYPEYEIINPSSIGKASMDTFYRLIDESNLLIFSEYKLWLGKGVFQEVEYAIPKIETTMLRKKQFYKISDLELLKVNKNWQINYAKVFTNRGTAKEDFLKTHPPSTSRKRCYH